MRFKKILIKLMVLILLGVTLLVLFVSYLISNGFHDYKKYCSEYIPRLEDFKNQKGFYPDNLILIEKPELYFRYKKNDCRYLIDSRGYSFKVEDGILGWSFYYSDIDRWKHD